MSFRKFSIYIAFLSVFILILTGCSNSTDSSSSSTTTEKTTFQKSINSSTPVVWFYAEGTNFQNITENELPTIGKDSNIYCAFVNQNGNSHFYTFRDNGTVTLKDFKNLTGQKLVDKVKKLAKTERVQGNKLKVHITTDETGNNTKSEKISYASGDHNLDGFLYNPITLSNSAVQGTVYNNLYLGFKFSGLTAYMLITPVTGEKATVELDK